MANFFNAIQSSPFYRAVFTPPRRRQTMQIDDYLVGYTRANPGSDIDEIFRMVQRELLTVLSQELQDHLQYLLASGKLILSENLECIYPGTNELPAKSTLVTFTLGFKLDKKKILALCVLRDYTGSLSLLDISLQQIQSLFLEACREHKLKLVEYLVPDYNDVLEDCVCSAGFFHASQHPTGAPVVRYLLRQQDFLKKAAFTSGFHECIRSSDSYFYKDLRDAYITYGYLEPTEETLTQEGAETLPNEFEHYLAFTKFRSRENMVWDESKECMAYFLELHPEANASAYVGQLEGINSKKKRKKIEEKFRKIKYELKIREEAAMRQT